ncbi:MAG: cyclohexanecarboxylate-CoA ligase [Actinomycetota bacterium]|nr:cyclohexanecarboxylate-CoA ligase [Actinomycetota bacterium]
MHFDADNLPIRRPSMVAAGHWRDITINDSLDEVVATNGDALALTATQFDSGEVRSFTYNELNTMVNRVAVGLYRLGIRPSDVVAVQLPNWWEFTVSHLACARIGAVTNPLMHIFRERELEFMLNHGEAVAAIIPSTFRGHDFAAMYDDIRSKVPSLEHVIAIGDGGPFGFEALLSGPSWEDETEAESILAENRPSADDVTQLIYTSGTTGEPKGVMHSANTMYSNIVPYAERLNLDSNDVVLMASPMAHQTGFMYGLMMPVVLGCPAVILDVWDAPTAISIVNDYGATFTMASTPFLADLTDTVATAGTGVPSLSTFLCAGAPIPGPLVERAQPTLGTTIVSAWGMSENGAITTTMLDDDPSRSVDTDGCPLPGVEVRIADDDGTALPTGEIGRLLARACSNFGGYLKRPHLNATDADGWFDTGDLARVDDRGYIRITGRSKDVIIRGGENIPVVEIENLLYRHPSVAQVAIVAYPDERLGERACAVIVAKPDTSIEFDGMIEFLTSERVAKNYLPERLEVLDAMPTTPSGKIQKFKLRDMIVGA